MPPAPAPPGWRRRAVALVALIAAAAGGRRSISRSVRRNLPGAAVGGAPDCAAEQRSIEELVAQVESASGAQSGGRPRLGGARRRSICGSAASTTRCKARAQCAAAARSDRRARGRSRRGADRGGRTASSRPRPRRRSSARWRLDAGELKARYFLGLAAEQDGSRPKRCADLARAAGARAGRCAVGRTDRAIAGAGRSGSGAAAGPSADDVAAAQNLLAGAARGHGARHGGAARRTPEEGRRRRRRLAAAGARLYGAGRRATRRETAAARRAPGARRAMPTSCGRLDELVKGLGLEG